MCYKYPGPRCSKHAKDKLQKALRVQKLVRKSNPEAKNRADEQVKIAQRDFLTSPEGIKQLKEKAAKSGKESDRKIAESFAQRRKDLIALSKEASGKAKIEREKFIKDHKIQDEPPKVAKVASSPLREPIALLSQRTLSSVNYDYDYSGCANDDCGEDGDMCRDTVYEGLTVENKPVDTRQVLAELYSTSPQNIPDELVAIGNDELNLDKPESYEAYAENGYYGEEPGVYLGHPETVQKRLMEYFHSLPDAKDDQGILPYVRGRGTDTTGLSPVEAVKKNLRDENNGKLVSYVEKTTKVSRGAVSLSKVIVPQKKHYETVLPKIPNSPVGADSITGVLVSKGDSLVLVDGYHRFKHANITNKKMGTFLILY